MTSEHDANHRAGSIETDRFGKARAWLVLEGVTPAT